MRSLHKSEQRGKQGRYAYCIIYPFPSFQLSCPFIPALTANGIFVVSATGQEGLQEEISARIPFRRSDHPESGHVHQLRAVVGSIAYPINAATTSPDGGFPLSDVSDDGTGAFANARSQRSPWRFQR